ncbi:putative phage tail assembly chaperone [Dasania marina]|uniref:putative phage tail assembly chaperone n=1 Tax=Dasania marina TaxID=471499 RepID=UPI00037E03BE|nr:putative phage tail assembly chaperone [Dasania marina]
MSKNNNQNGTETITLELSNGKELAFHLTPEKYTKYIDAMQPHNKVNPAINFLMSVVDEDHKEYLRDLVKNPATAIAITGEVIEDYGNDVVVSAKKKSSGSPSEKNK